MGESVYRKRKTLPISLFKIASNSGIHDKNSENYYFQRRA